MPVDAWVCEAYQAQISQLCAALLQTVCVRSWQASRTVGDVGCRPGSQGNTASREPILNSDARQSGGTVVGVHRYGAHVTTTEEIRHWATALPEVEETSHFRFHVPVFKVRGRTFLGMGKDETTAVFCVSARAADEAAAADPATCEAVRRRDARRSFFGAAGAAHQHFTGARAWSCPGSVASAGAGAAGHRARPASLALPRVHGWSDPAYGSFSGATAKLPGEVLKGSRF